MATADAMSREALSALSHGALVDLVLGAQGGAASAQTTTAGLEEASPPNKKQRKTHEKRSFDMSRHSQRHIALRVAYIGTAYQGFAWQIDAPTGTVEGQLVQALVKTCLITDRNSCGISCGGRTDKGVSGVGQVVALRVRSNMSEGDGVIPAPAANGAADEQAAAEQATTQSHTVGERRELDYCKMLNSCLPSDVRVLAWRPTDAEFSARFSATGRTYKYFFQLRDLDVAKMREAASRLVGEHDLRNFCKIDPSVNSFVRSILSFDVEPVEQFAGGLSRESPEAVWAFTVHGTAFLYHQVRCMVAVLFLVGEGKEAPEIISTLLDIERTPRRPNYDMASDAPLLLYRIHYNETGNEWVTEPNASAAIANLWAEQQRGLMLRSAMLHAMRDTLPETSTRVAHTSGKGHVPLTQRPTHESVETRTKGRAK